MDLHNGSYLASIPLLFEGTPKVKVSVTYPREILRVVFYLRNVMKGMRLNVGGFVSEFARYDFQFFNIFKLIVESGNVSEWSTRYSSLLLAKKKLIPVCNCKIHFHSPLHYTFKIFSLSLGVYLMKN